MLGFNGRDYNFSIEERNTFYEEITKNLPSYHVLLKTCDRVELYYEDYNLDFNQGRIFSIVKHLFGLTSGVESPIIGECHILSQVKSAYENALKNKTTSRLLNLLFQKALNVGKKVRTLTKISEGSPSHSLAAFSIVKKHFNNLKNVRVAIIGVNTINENLLKYFQKYGVSQIYLGNRTYEKAVIIGEKYKACVFKLEELKSVLKYSDVLIVATSAPHLIVKKDVIEKNKKMIIIDLSSPRNVDKDIAKMKNIFFYDLHDTEQFIANSMKDRLIEKERAEEIVIKEAEKFIFQIESKLIKI